MKQAEAEAGTRCLSLKQRPTDGDVFRRQVEGFSAPLAYPHDPESWIPGALAFLHVCATRKKCVDEQIHPHKGCGPVTSRSRSRSEWVNTSSALVSTSTADATTTRITTLTRVNPFLNSDAANKLNIHIQIISEITKCYQPAEASHLSCSAHDRIHIEHLISHPQWAASELRQPVVNKHLET